jgi:hypothetical protein
MTEEQLKRLPQYAQETIRQLEWHNVRLEKTLEAAYRSRGQVQEDLQDSIDTFHVIQDGKGDPVKLATAILNKLIYRED